MKAFNKHNGKIAVINRGNIDTDQIISKEHLKSVKRTGFGETLFSDWRYLDDGSENPDFELNQTRFKDTTILVAGNNFGCGSSREHAVWAIVQYGFAVVIAPRKETSSDPIPAFADIFFNNSSKNGLLLIELSEEETNQIIAAVDQQEGLTATIDLPSQTITVNSDNPLEIKFDIDSSIKNRLVKGLDDIGVTEQYLDQISKFEESHSTWV